MQIRKATFQDQRFIWALYQKVALLPDGIIRNPDEVTEGYITQFLEAAIHHGLILVGSINDTIVAEIHAITPNICAFQHLLTDLTIVVDPDLHGRGIGKSMFNHFLETVKADYPHILRVELFTREHNEKNVQFYEKLGFINEGRQDRKIFVSQGHFHTPIHMAWFNPNSNF
jgi:ribosomal protein S18 acetylase RimI-like enzyme